MTRPDSSSGRPMIVNLNKARKQRSRETAKAEASRNRIAHGRTRAEREADETARALGERRLDGAKLEP